MYHLGLPMAALNTADGGQGRTRGGEARALTAPLPQSLSITCAFEGSKLQGPDVLERKERPTHGCVMRGRQGHCLSFLDSRLRHPWPQ